MIEDRQQREGWGSSVIPRLSAELRNELPELKGFSTRNMDRMVAFYRDYPHPDQFLPQPVAKLEDADKSPQAVAKLQPEVSLLWSVPWGHHVHLMTKVKDADIRRWYMEQTLANGWSRNVLTLMIESDAHRRAGKAVSNFEQQLPAPQSDLVQQTLKDPYIFDFLTGIDKPIGVSSYELTRALPKSLQSVLPTVEQIEAELSTLDAAKQSAKKKTSKQTTKKNAAKKRKGTKRKNDSSDSEGDK